MSQCDCATTELADYAAVPGAPVACTIEKGGMAKRVEDFREAFGMLVSSRRTPHGFSWVFRDDPGFEAVLRDLAAREHACCQFLAFTISREDGHLVWEVDGTPEAAGAVEVFYALPQTIHQDVEQLKREAERAGLPCTNDGPSGSRCC